MKEQNRIRLLILLEIAHNQAQKDDLVTAKQLEI